MKKVLLALLGLILLTILSFFCFQDKADAIREDLISSTTQALQSNDLSTAHVTLQGEDKAMTDIIQLSGEVPNLEAKAKAESIARAIPGVGSVLNQLTVQAKQGDRTQEVATTPQDTTATAEVPPVKEAKEPYALTITKDEKDTLILEGFIASKDKEDALLAEAKKLFPKRKVKNLLKIKEDAPKDWEYISSFALNKLHEVDYGDMKLHGQSYEFTGHLASPSQKAEFLDGIRQVMSDPENKYGRYRGDYIITAPIEEPIIQEKHLAKKEKDTVPAQPSVTKPAVSKADSEISVCQQALDTLLAQQKVLFDYNKASLKSRSHSLLDKIASTVQSCHITKLEIGGHTDNIGRESYNQKLSEKRANTVKAYLVKKGIASDTLLAIGYGESHPIASNKTSKSRAKNRRIEFIVKEVK